jgi:hypothetical protein
VKELRRFAFKCVPDELEDPSDQKERESINPHTVNEDACDKKRNRDKDSGDAKGVACLVHRMLMAAGVLCDPLLASAVAKHSAA